MHSVEGWTYSGGNDPHRQRDGGEDNPPFTHEKHPAAGRCYLWRATFRSFRGMKWLCDKVSFCTVQQNVGLRGKVNAQM